MYRVLGKSDSSEGVESTNGDDQSEQSRDAHLKDYDSEIFDDDDFYHQVQRRQLLWCTLKDLYCFDVCSCFAS